MDESPIARHHFSSLAQLDGKPLLCHFHGLRYLERRVEGAHAFQFNCQSTLKKKCTTELITQSHSRNT
jgi:hypothetical protein